MKIGQTLLLYYCAFLSVFITLGAAAFGLRSGNLLFFILFLPVVAYLSLTVFKLRKGFKLLLYYNFILITIMAIMGFVGTRSAPQLISAVLFLPLTVYFWLLVLPKRSKKLTIPDNIMPALPENKTQEKKVTKVEVLPSKKLGKSFDLDRRKFVKLIGSTGLTLFLFSIFTKKAQAAFFGSVPGPGTVALKDTTGAQVDPAIKHPTDGYKVARVDDSTTAYYGFVNKDGAWFIMREESNGTYKYASGTSNFLTTGWNIRNTTLEYADFYDVF